MKKAYIAAALLAIVSAGIALYIYPSMPERYAMHWNVKGEADGYSEKTLGLFMFPVMITVMMLVYMLLPRIDPLRKNIEAFRRYYDSAILFVIAFMFYIQSLTVLWNSGNNFNMSLAIIPGFAMFFYYIGSMLKHSKRNWFLGIRTPWTLSSDRVWEKTHELGSKLFKAAAVISLLGIFLRDYSFLFMTVPVIAFSVYLAVYSYIEYKKDDGKAM